jgi:hypothetical protein
MTDEEVKSEELQEVLERFSDGIINGLEGLRNINLEDYATFVKEAVSRLVTRAEEVTYTDNPLDMIQMLASLQEVDTAFDNYDALPEILFTFASDEDDE